MKRLQKRLADAAVQWVERNAPPQRDPREQDAFVRMAEVRAQQIWGGMDPRTAQRTWDRMTHEQTKRWVEQLVEALAAEWPGLDDLQRAEWQSLIQHMDSFRRAHKLPRSFAPWSPKLRASAQEDFIRSRHVPQTEAERSQAAAQLNQFALMRHQTAMSTIQNIR
jgi:hypothetical protein